jgi:hypothetical protein
LDLPVSRMIAFVPSPSPLSNTILAREWLDRAHS